MHFLHYGSLENLIFQMLTGTAEIPRFMTTSMSVVHSVSFSAVSTEDAVSRLSH